MPERCSPPQIHRAQQVQLNPGADLEWNLPPILHQAHVCLFRSCIPPILNHGIATPTPATPSCSSCSTYPSTSTVYFPSSTTDSTTKFPSIPPYFVFSIFVSASHIYWRIGQKSRTSHSLFSREGWPASQRLRGSGNSRLHPEERARYVMMARLAVASTYSSTTYQLR